MDPLRNRLPPAFPAGVKSNLSPAEMFDVLRDLYAQESKLSPSDNYLRHHGSPGSVLNKIYTFCDYAPFLPASGRVLDWGCNHAPDSALMRAAFGNRFELFACDFRAPSLYPAFQNFSQVDYRKINDVVRLPFENESLDTVIASGALEHVASDYRSLEELYRVLKHDGQLIINYLPNRFSVHEKIQEYVRKENFHYRQYSLSSARMLLKGNGFFPIFSGYQSYFWEKALAKIGIQKRNLVHKVLSGFFPIHLVGGCVQLVALKKISML
jgi:SAM-dependent methyltransferase